MVTLQPHTGNRSGGNRCSASMAGSMFQSSFISRDLCWVSVSKPFCDAMGLCYHRSIQVGTAGISENGVEELASGKHVRTGFQRNHERSPQPCWQFHRSSNDSIRSAVLVLYRSWIRLQRDCRCGTACYDMTLFSC